MQEDTSQAAYQHASKDADQVRQVLHSNGIEPKAANLGFLSVQPMYDGLLMSAAQNWRYQAATRDGEPVKYRKMIQINVNR